MEAKAYTFPRSLRLIRTADYGAIVHARGENVLRIHSKFFSAIAVMRTGASGGRELRFGITVGKRNSPRSVDRALVKRILRESARHAAQSVLERISMGEGMDVSLRLKTPLTAAGTRTASAELKRTLREDADELHRKLIVRLDKSRGNER